MANTNSSLLGSIASGVTSAVSSSVQAASKVASSGISAASSLGQTAVSATSSIASSAISATANVASSVVSSASSVVSNVTGSGSSVVSSVLASASNIAGSTIGTTAGVLNSVITGASDAVSSIVNDVANTAAGAIDSLGSAVGSATSGDTMGVLSSIASGQADSQSAQNILGDASEKLASACGGCCGGASGSSSGSCSSSSASSGISQAASAAATAAATAAVASVASQINATAQAACATASAAIAAASAAVQKGISYFATLNSVVGSSNGATSILQATLNNMMDMAIATMMTKVVSAIETAHGVTHPLFVDIFAKTWSENKQWIPDHIKADLAAKYGDPGDGSCIPKPYDPVKELIEYFDFVQKVMGGAIAEIMKNIEDVTDSACAAAEQAYKAAKAMGKPNASLCLNVTVSLPSIPMMSISKQIEDLQRKFSALKQIVRWKAKMLIERIKSLETPDLKIVPPKAFIDAMNVLIEANYIYNHLHIVIDKLLEYFLNMLVQKFTQYADQIISKLFSIWNSVVEIVPPLQDLLNLAWAIPNQADACCNVALNLALDQAVAMVMPTIMAPFQMVDQIAQACDMACAAAYAIPPP